MASHVKLTRFAIGVSLAALALSSTAPALAQPAAAQRATSAWGVPLRGWRKVHLGPDSCDVKPFPPAPPRLACARGDHRGRGE